MTVVAAGELAREVRAWSDRPGLLADAELIRWERFRAAKPVGGGVGLGGVGIIFGWGAGRRSEAAASVGLIPPLELFPPQLHARAPVAGDRAGGGRVGG